MSFLKKIKRTAISDRLIEEKLYEQVLREFESGVRRDGLWAKAFQKSRGDEQKANALYLKYRVQSIKDETEIDNMLAESANESDIPRSQKRQVHHRHKGPEAQCKTCGYVVFGVASEEAKKHKCPDCGSIVGDKPIK